MQFVFLTAPEVEGVSITWCDETTKTAELIAAAVAAGFSEWEASGSPLGVLEQDLALGTGCICWRGAITLLGTNGSTLIEVAAEPNPPR